MNWGCVNGDICEVQVDAVVNAANESLLGGGGVDGAIHKAAGPKLREYCDKQVQIVDEDNVVDGWCARCKTGRAVITPSFEMKNCKHIIHTVGPIWHGGWKGEVRKLAQCYYSCLDMALAWGCKSIAFPCISAGCYKFPLGLATEVAVRTVGRWMKANGSTLKVVFVTYTKEANEVYHDTLKWWAEWDRNRREKDGKGRTVRVR